MEVQNLHTTIDMRRNTVAVDVGCVARVPSVAFGSTFVVVWFPDPSCMGGVRKARAGTAPAVPATRLSSFFPSPFSPHPYRKGLGTKLLLLCV